MNVNTFASLDSLNGAKIGVFGLGVTGKAACRLAKACGSKLLVVNQSIEKLDEVDQFLLQDDPAAADSLADCELILLSPGIARTHPVLSKAIEKKIPIWNEIELGFRILRTISPQTKWLAITGTNGKTTTVTLLGQMLEEDGRGYFVGGNIGTPLCDLLADYCLGKIKDNNLPATVILELSSFQLESLVEFRPHAAAILNISASHGERYAQVRDYAEAKGQIVKKLGPADIFLSLKGDTWTEKVIRLGAWFWERVDADNIDFAGFSIAKYKPFGRHNLVNLAFAIRLAQVAGAESEAIQRAIDKFEGVSHRLEKVLESSTKLILNDSKSTNWASSLAALNSVQADQTWSKQRITLVIGGKCRGHHDMPDKETLERLAVNGIEVFLFGEFGHKYEKPMQELFPKCRLIEKFEKILSSWSGEGVLLFSPAFPSFDEFGSYSERGDRFKSLVNAG